MSKHTPGSWKCVRIHSEDAHDARHIIALDGTVVAILPGSTNEEMDKADSRLLAAAPELLEALKLARKRMLQAGLVGDMNTIDSALSKAECPPVLSLSFKEFCTVTAALRVFSQVRAAGGNIPGHPRDRNGSTHNMTAQAETLEELEHFDECEPLTEEEIEELAERLDYD
jgi:hypothetical protein